MAAAPWIVSDQLGLIEPLFAEDGAVSAGWAQPSARPGDGQIEWARAVVDASHVQATKRGAKDGPEPG
jgi:hypothetical protein